MHGQKNIKLGIQFEIIILAIIIIIIIIL